MPQGSIENQYKYYDHTFRSGQGSVDPCGESPLRSPGLSVLYRRSLKVILNVIIIKKFSPVSGRKFSLFLQAAIMCTAAGSAGNGYELLFALCLIFIPVHAVG